MDNEENNIKLILVGGASGVGVTNILNVYFGMSFQEGSITTNSPYSFEGEFNKGKKGKSEISKLTFWDSGGGQDILRALKKPLILRCNIILIVYSITDRDSFENVEFWINCIKEIKNEVKDDKYIVALIANKSDLFDSQVVSDEEGEKIADKYGIEFLITSAKQDQKSFRIFVHSLITKYIENYLNPNQEKKNDNEKHTGKKLVGCVGF